MYPRVPFEPGFAVSKLSTSKRRAVDAFQHAEAELGYQRPLGSTGSADRSGNGSRHRAAVENMREEGMPPQAGNVNAGDVHLARC